MKIQKPAGDLVGKSTKTVQVECGISGGEIFERKVDCILEKDRLSQ